MNGIFDKLAEHGLEPRPEDVIPDKKLRRFKVDAGDTKKSGWIIGFQNHTVQSGEEYHCYTFGNFKEDLRVVWQTENITLTAEDKKIIAQNIKDSQKKEEAIKREYQDLVSNVVSNIWDGLRGDGVSEYLYRKQINSCENLGIKFALNGQGVFVPLRDVHGKIWSTQGISNEGQKMFYRGGRKDGCFHVIGNLEKSDKILICEGFATGASLHMATKLPVVVAFDSGNLKKVAKALKSKHSMKVFVVCGDDDVYTTRKLNNEDVPYNPGRESAEEAAKNCMGRAVFPEFQNPEKNLTDFNDLHVKEGLMKVAEQVMKIEVKQVFLRELGYSGQLYYFTSSDNKQITEISNFTDEAMMKILPLEYWENRFPGQGKAKVDWSAAKNTLMQRCRERGQIELENIRGSGVWSDQGRVVVNMGDYLIVDGMVTDFYEIRSDFFYTLSTRLKSIHPSPLTVEECSVLVRACTMLNWKESGQEILLAGALVTSRVCGAIKVRPHVWLTGEAGAGKTTVLQELIRPIVGPNCLYVQGTTTEAGLRQTIRNNAIPVIFDEFETGGERSNENVDKTIELMRSAWSDSDAKILKGSAGGMATSFSTKFSAIVSSIRTKLDNEADNSRFAKLELVRHGSDPEQLRALNELLCQITPEFSERLFARTLKMLPVFFESFRVIKPMMARIAGQRFADQYGTLLAAAYTLMSNEPFTEETAGQLMALVHLQDEKTEADTADQDNALGYMLSKKLRIDYVMGKEQRTSHGALSMLLIEAMEDGFLRDALQAYGLRLMLTEAIKPGEKPYLSIWGRSNEFENTFFKGTKWSRTATNSLARIKGAYKSHDRIANIGQRTLRIPLSELGLERN